MIPTKPDGDWVLVVRKRDRAAAAQMVVAPSDDYPRNDKATLIVSDKGELLLFYGASGKIGVLGCPIKTARAPGKPKNSGKFLPGGAA